MSIEDFMSVKSNKQQLTNKDSSYFGILIPTYLAFVVAKHSYILSKSEKKSNFFLDEFIYEHQLDV